MQFWDKTLEFFRALWIDTWTTLENSVGRLWGAFTRAWNVYIEGPMDDVYLAEVDKFVREWKLEEKNVAFLYRIRQYTFPFDFICAAIAITALMLLQLWNTLQAAMKRFKKEALEQERPETIDPSLLVSWAYRNPERKHLVDKLLAELGYPDDQIDMLYQSAQSLPAVGEVLQLLLRKEITENAALNMLTRQGFSDRDAEKMLTLRWQFPSPQDVVSLAGREAFEEDQVREYELDKDMPEEMFQWGEKFGFSRETLRLYWIAHWSHPSINQVFEMIQRKAPKKGGGVWSLADLPVFFKMADINPYFTESLKHIAYNVYTRVDIRRMYEMGVLKEDDLQRVHEELGYPPDKAAKLKEFVIRSVHFHKRDLSKSNIDTLYKAHLVDALEYRRLLGLLGYDTQETYYLQDLADLQNEKAEVDAKVSLVEYQFKRDLIDEAAARSGLTQAGVKQQGVGRYIATWTAEKPQEKTRPSKQDLLDWLKAGTISAAEFTALMKEANYKASDIDRYLASLTPMPSRSEVLEWFSREQITEAEATAYLKKLGFADKEITLYLVAGRETIQRRKDARDASKKG
jgi:hypothetical protein